MKAETYDPDYHQDAGASKVKPTWHEVRDDEPIYSPEQGDGRKSDVLDWARYGWPATIALAGCLIWLVPR